MCQSAYLTSFIFPSELWLDLTLSSLLFLLLHIRLLSQLDETERAFDEFWVRHQTKLEQCLQLRHFEHNYREVSWTFFFYLA